MIKEISLRPKPRNKNAVIAFSIALAVSFAVFAVYLAIDRYKGIVGMLGLFTLTTAILFYTKFIAPTFYYDITFDANETPVFVVRQITGKRQTTLCRINLADITAVKRETRREQRAHKTPSGTLKYVYAPTMMPPEIFRIYVSGQYERAEILIEASEEFANLLLEYAEEARLSSEEE